MTYTFRGTMSGRIVGDGWRHEFVAAEVCFTLVSDPAAIEGAGTAQLASASEASVAIAGLERPVTISRPATLGVASGLNSLMLLDLRAVRCLLGTDLPGSPQDLTAGFELEGPAIHDPGAVTTDRGDLVIDRVHGPITIRATPPEPWQAPERPVDRGAIERPSGPRSPEPGLN